MVLVELHTRAASFWTRCFIIIATTVAAVLTLQIWEAVSRKVLSWLQRYLGKMNNFNGRSNDSQGLLQIIIGSWKVNWLCRINNLWWRWGSGEGTRFSTSLYKVIGAFARQVRISMRDFWKEIQDGEPRSLIRYALSRTLPNQTRESRRPHAPSIIAPYEKKNIHLLDKTDKTA